MPGGIRCRRKDNASPIQIQKFYLLYGLISEMAFLAAAQPLWEDAGERRKTVRLFFKVPAEAGEQEIRR
ncbi:hypothetical protein [Shinella sp. BYT-45]|uniref:hypothetical protein n=1 Tax=Shinella sp. BYT-45 TaxID=3377377 RepID=UPI003980E5FD